MSALLKFFTGRSNADTETFLATAIEQAGFTAAEIRTAADAKNTDFLSQSVSAAAFTLTAERDAEKAKAGELATRITAIESAFKASGIEIAADKLSDTAALTAAVAKRIEVAASQGALTIVQARGIQPVATTIVGSKDSKSDEDFTAELNGKQGRERTEFVRANWDRIKRLASAQN